MDLLLWSRRLSAYIAVYSRCPGEEEGPLPILAKHLFLGLRNRRILEQKALSLDGAEGLVTTLEATLDGRPVTLQSVVVKQLDCLYDLIYFAPPGAFASGLPEFESFLSGWRFVPAIR